MAFLFAPTNLVGTHTWLGRRQFRSSSINHGLTSLNTRRKAGISMTKQEDNGANGQDTSSRKPQYSFRTRLREETEAPFRKARMFVYGGCAISASVGAFIASLRVIAALSGVSGVQPLNETIPNVAIDIGVIALFVALLRYESNMGKKRLERMSRGARLGGLRVQDGMNGQVQMLKDFRGKKRVVIVAGDSDKVLQGLADADSVSGQLEENNVILVGLPLGADSNDGQRWQPYAISEWQKWLKTERDGLKQAQVVVVIVKMNGRVGGRSKVVPSVGMWERLVEEVQRLPYTYK